MDKTTPQPDKPTRSGLIHRAGLLLGFVLVNLPAQALDTGHLDATEPMGAVQELVEKLGYPSSGACHVNALQFGEGRATSRYFFKLTCPDRALFVKHDTTSHAVIFSSVLNIMEQQLAPDDLAAVLVPLAEFSFGRSNSPEGSRFHEAWSDYYGVYPWVEGLRLGDLHERIMQSDSDPASLIPVYRRLGSQLGTLHSAGLLAPDKPLQELKSSLIHWDLHADNIMVTPDAVADIVILDTDHFHLPSQAGLVTEVLSKNFPQYLLSFAMGFDLPWSTAWLNTLPELAEALVASYCQALVGDEKKATCVSGLVDLLKQEIASLHAQAQNDRKSWLPRPFASETPSPLVDRTELHRRLETVFSFSQRH